VFPFFRRRVGPPVDGDFERPAADPYLLQVHEQRPRHADRQVDEAE
jgi:hypothetical protein